MVRYAISNGHMRFIDPSIARDFNDRFDGDAEFFKHASRQNCHTVLTAADTPFDWLLNHRSQLVYKVTGSSKLWIGDSRIAKATDEIIALFLTNATYPSNANIFLCAWVGSWINSVEGMDADFISNALANNWYGLQPPSGDVVAAAIDALATFKERGDLVSRDREELLSADAWFGLLNPVKDETPRLFERIAVLPLRAARERPVARTP